MSARLAAFFLAFVLAVPAPALAGARRVTAPAYPQVSAGILGVEGSLTLLSEASCRCPEGEIVLSFRDGAGRVFVVELRRRDGRLSLSHKGEALVIAPGSAEEAALYHLIRPKAPLLSGLRVTVLSTMERHAAALSPSRLQALARLRLR